MMTQPHKVLIIGGGFGGVKAAQELSRLARSLVSVQLVDRKTAMEYHAASYRLVTGRSPMEVCLPYRDLFTKCPVQVDQDSIVSVDPQAKTAVGTSGTIYHYDSLILATGSVPETYHVPGIEKFSFGVDSATSALRLKRHIHEMFESSYQRRTVGSVPRLHFIIVGGGATGVELAGEIAAYAPKLAKAHGVAPSMIAIDLVESGGTILGFLPPSLQQKVQTRLRSLGVNIFFNRSIVREDAQALHLADADIASKSIIWAAGMRGSPLLSSIPGLEVNAKGRVSVTDQMQVKNFESVYAIGDAAATKYSGMAQTAIADAVYVARHIKCKLTHSLCPKYIQSAPSYAVPVGPMWAAVLYHGISFSGVVGWTLRRAADMRAFLALLPLRKALRAFASCYAHTESCPVCRA